MPGCSVKDFDGLVDGAGQKNRGRPMGQIPPRFLEGLADVYGHGSRKYAPGNWLRGGAWSANYDALQRHLSAFWRGEDIDTESGLPHVLHAAWHCATLFTFASDPAYAKYDDRLFKGPRPARQAVPDTPDRPA